MGQGDASRNPERQPSTGQQPALMVASRLDSPQGSGCPKPGQDSTLLPGLSLSNGALTHHRSQPVAGTGNSKSLPTSIQMKGIVCPLPSLPFQRTPAAPSRAKAGQQGRTGCL
jgi:hypothetical protein